MSSNQHSARHRDRLLMGLGAVFSVAEAAALLPLQDAEARQWLRDNALVRTVARREVVAWIDVVASLREAGAQFTPDLRPRSMAHPAPERVSLQPLAGGRVRDNATPKSRKP